MIKLIALLLHFHIVPFFGTVCKKNESLCFVIVIIYIYQCISVILNLFDPHLIWFRDVKYFELGKKLFI